MGKPFKHELNQLDSTYKFTSSIELSSFQKSLSGLTNLISVGSGGSLTSAQFSALLHREGGNMAISTTPLELLSFGKIISKSSVLFVTAGGGNHDILNSFRYCVESEPQKLSILCATKNSPISKLAMKYDCVDVFDFDLPCGKDGFLATNSLLGFNTILLRAYNRQLELPKTIDALVHPEISRADFMKDLFAQAAHISSRQTFSVIFGEWGSPAAFDLESKFTEAALGNVQLANFRNFAHGRHNWLAKQSEQTAVIALVTPYDEVIANKTLANIPKEIPILKLVTKCKSGPLAALDLIIKTLFLVGIIGEAKNIDPGRPGVASFGVKLYNLHLPTSSLKLRKLSHVESVAIIRKMKSSEDDYENQVKVSFWENAHHSFIKKLTSARFDSLVLDYDGTICQPSHRFSGLSPVIGTMLSSLLENNIKIGIATGRGKSVREELQKVIPRNYWPQVTIGYYNCSDIASLSNNDRPNKTGFQDEMLTSLLDSMIDNNRVMTEFDCESRPKQISFIPKQGEPQLLMNELRIAIEKNSLYGLQVLESSHSIDVLAPNVSKIALLKTMGAELDRTTETHSLCIGDRGKWPGNDFALLSSEYSLSADTVSTDPKTCWNLAPPGHKGVQATIGYLKDLAILQKGFMHFNYNMTSVK